jgi:hypothetical protein
MVNRWSLEEVEYVNISYLIPYKLAENYLEDILN